MLKTQNRKARSSKKNKGFSLVELIVVIAIMAVLVAVLAPQFTKYIDQSRKSNDAATVAGIVAAAEVGIADTTNYTVGQDTYEITLTRTSAAAITKGGTAITADGSKNLADAIVAACGPLSDLKITSNNWTDDKVVITIKYADGAVAVEYSADFQEYIK